MATVALLCEIIAQDAKASTETFSSRAGYEALIRQGLITEGQIIQSLACEECSEPHDAEVVFEGGQYGFYCPEIGFVPVERSKLIAVKPDLQKLVGYLAARLECNRRKETPVEGLTWRIGTLETIVGDLTIYFHPRLQSSEDAHRLEAALQREVLSPLRLILTASGSLAIIGAKTACLNEVLELDLVSGEVAKLSDMRAIVEAPLESPGGRRNLYRAKLNTLIRMRIGNGEALKGRNEEAKALRSVFQSQYPTENSPSLPTIKRYLSEARSGS